MAYDYAVQVTVPAGKVSTTLTDFVVRLKLDDLPATWWEGTASDLGGVRVRLANGTEVPFDLVRYDRAAKTGELYFKRTLTTAQTTVYVHTLAALSALPAPTDPNGRDAVWSDYDVVAMLGPGGSGAINRKGGAALELVEPLARDAWDWRTKAVYEHPTGAVTVGCVSADETRMYYARQPSTSNTAPSTSNSIKMVDVATGAITLTNSTVVQDAGIAFASSGRSFNGIFEIDGELVLLLSALISSNYQHWVCYFDPLTLTFLRKVAITTAIAAQNVTDFAGFWNPDTREWLVDPLSSLPLKRFDEDWNLLGTVTKAGSYVAQAEVATYMGGGRFLTYTNNTSAGIQEMVLDNPSAPTTATYGPTKTVTALDVGGHGFLDYKQASGKFYIGYALASPPRVKVYERETELGGFGGRHYYKVAGLPRRTIYMMGATVVAQNVASGIVSYGSNDTTDGNRATLTQGAGSAITGRAVTGFSSANSQTEPAPLAEWGEAIRAHHGYNNTAHRSLWRNGVQKLAQTSSVSVRPPVGVVSAAFFIGAEDTSASAVAVTSIGQAYLRPEYLSAAWLSAEFASWRSPTTFYQITSPTEVGQAGETDSTFPMADVVYLGQALEVDDIQGNVRHKSPLGTTVETTTTYPLPAVRLLGLPSSTESTFAATVVQPLPIIKLLGLASETDSLLAATVVQRTPITVTFGQASETDSAHALIPPTPITVVLGRPQETDAAIGAVVKTAQVFLGFAIETDSVLKATPTKPFQKVVALGYPSEKDSAPSAAKLTISLRQAIEYDSGLLAVPNQTRVVTFGIAAENTITYEVLGQTLVRYWDGTQEGAAVLLGYWDGRQIRLGAFAGRWNGVEVVDL